MSGSALGIASGGTSQTTAAGARIALGLEVGVDVQPADADLTEIAALTGTGFPARTGTNTWSLRTIIGTTNRLDVLNGAGIAGNPTLDISATYAGQTSITTLGTITVGTWNATDITVANGGTGVSTITGIVTGNGTANFVGRTLTGTAGQVTVTNGDGVSGNPTISLPVGALMPVGSVVDYAGASAPTGWLFCFGQAISRATYAALFAAIDVLHGVGDGSTTFNVPDYRGRVSAGKDDMGGSSANRLTTPINGDTLGAAGGAETVTLATANLPSHDHAISFTSGGQSVDHTHVAAGTTGTISVNHTHTFSDTTGTGSANHTHTIATALTVAAGASAPVEQPTGTASTQTTSSSGASHTHVASGTTGTVSANHTHSFSDTTTGTSVGHTHAISGTSDTTGSGTAATIVQPTLIMNKIIYTGV